MLKNIKKDKKALSLYILAGIFFFVYSFLSFGTFGEPMRFNSPDETANYFFAKKLAETGEPFYTEDQNLRANDVIHPRSTKSIDGKVVPTSFLGMIIFYGFIAKILGTWVIPFLTPLIAVIGVLFFYLFLKNIFEEKVAYLSSIFLFFIPAYWYYSSKAMYHNVPFLVLLMVGFYLLSIQLKDKKRGKYIFFSGLFIGLALTFRLSEIIWIFLVLFVIGFYYFNKIKTKKILLFGLGLLLPLALMFFYNSILYSSPFSSGYVNQNNQDQNKSIFVSIYNLILPFGFNIKAIIKNFLNYFLFIFWFFSVPAVVGFFVALKGKVAKKKKVYLVSYLALAVFLLVYYGSWQIKDNISFSSVTIGNSYVRYWLPMYVFALPFISILILKLAKLSILKNKIIYFFIAFFGLVSFNMVFVKGEECVLRVRDNILDYKKEAEQIYNITEEDSVIISRYEDKVFFPDRKVVFFNPNNYGAFEGLVKIIDENRIYFYDKFIPQKDLDYINNKKIKDLGLKVIKLDNYLYEVVKQ